MLVTKILSIYNNSKRNTYKLPTKKKILFELQRMGLRKYCRILNKIVINLLTMSWQCVTQKHLAVSRNKNEEKRAFYLLILHVQRSCTYTHITGSVELEQQSQYWWQHYCYYYCYCYYPWYHLYVGYLQLYTWNVGYIVLQLFCINNLCHI